MAPEIADAPTFETASARAADGTTLSFRTAGDPGARPLVLVHGWAQSSQAWGFDLLSELATTYRVVAVDLRGHGLSDVAGEGYDDPRSWADDLAAVLDAAGVREGSGAVLLGWSYGGIVVSDYLAHHGEAAVGGIVLCGAVSGVSRAPGAAVGPPMMSVASGGFDTDPKVALEALVTFGEHLFHVPDGPGQQRLLGITLATPPEVRRKLLNRRVDNTETLSALGVPALVIHGARDEVVPPETGRANAETIPQSTSVVLPGVAHVPFLEAPEEFVAHLRDFTDGLE